MKSMDKGDSDPIEAKSKPRIRPEILNKMAGVPFRRKDGETSVPALPGTLTERDGGHAMERSRAGLARIDFLPPEHTPSAVAVARALPEEVRRRCRAALDLSPAAITAALSVLAAETRGVRPRARRSLEAMIAMDAPSDLDVHDIFFNIRRASKPKPAVYVESVLETLVAFRQDLAETPVMIGVPTLVKIETGLLTIISVALSEGPRRSPGDFPMAPAPRFEDHAARRWIRGHQIFAALNQGLTSAIERLDETIRGDQSRRDAVEHIVLGLEACAAALEFTGDFAHHIYDERIRPSMCPPYLPRGFSGLLSADHCHLVRRMKEMRPAMEALRACHPDGHWAVSAALSQVYDSHKHVCSKFVGTDRSSLLMMSETTRSSVEQLERFKAMRIRNLG